MFLEFVPAGARLGDASITGKNTFPNAGDRLLTGSKVPALSVGGPLLDAYGDYAGIMGGSIVPGSDPIYMLSLLSDPAAKGKATAETTGLAVPLALLPDVPASATPTRLADLATWGEFLTPVVKTSSIQSASLGTMGQGSDETLGDYKQVFAKKGAKPAVLVTWQVVAKEKFSCVLNVFSADNKLVNESKPRDIALIPGKSLTTLWEIPAAKMAAGIYRFDLVLNGKTAWRDFFRITE